MDGSSSAKEIQSPTFVVSVPSDQKGGKQEITWYLSIRDGKLHLMQQTTPFSLEDYFSSSAARKPRRPFRDFCIIDCVGSLLDQETGKAIQEMKVPSTTCTIGGLTTINFGNHDILANLQPNKPLIIQVNATLLFYADPISTTNNIGEVFHDSALKQLFEDKVFADLTIKCQDDEFKAHRAILACQSPVFKRMLEVDMKEKHCGIIEISDISPDVMSDLLAYLYTGTAPNMNKLAKELMTAANKYELSQLLVLCENTLMMTLSSENVLEILVHAERHQASNLKQICLKLIKTNGGILESESWKEFKKIDEYKSLAFEVLEFSIS